MIPDGTRSSPLPLLLRCVHEALAGRATRITAVVALGTHVAMSEEALAKHLGYAEAGLEATYPGMTVINHEWEKPETFVTLGTISAERVSELSGGLLAVAAEVALNRVVVDHDVALVIGPVFPHEVVGFSGGNKYFFPGIAGQQIIDLTHWVGALITSAQIIGALGDHPGAGPDQRGSRPDPQPTARPVRRGQVGQLRPARRVLRRLRRPPGQRPR